MNPRQGTWSEVTNGVVMQGPDLKHYLVVNEALDGTGQRWLRVQNAHRQEVSVKAHPDDEPVTIMETTEVEAIVSLGALGARVLHFEDKKTLPVRAMKWYVEPPRTAGRGALDSLRDHIVGMHGVHVADGFPQTAKTYAEWHQEMHSPEHITMLLPHTHTKES